MKICENSIPIVSKKVVWKQLGEDTMLLHLVTGNYFSLNKSGESFWSLVNGQSTLKEISSAVAAKANAPLGTVARDALMFFEALNKNKLVEFL